MSSISLATSCAVKMSEAKTIDQLRAVWNEVNSTRLQLEDGMYSWLRDFKDSRKIVLTTPELCEDDFNEKGKTWARDNGIFPKK